MAQIYSQSALPPLREQAPFFQPIGHVYPKECQTIMSRKYPEYPSQQQRSLSKSTSPTLASRSVHPEALLQRGKEEHRLGQEPGQAREPLPSFRSLLNDINQTHQTSQPKYPVRQTSPNFKRFSTDHTFPASTLDNAERSHSSLDAKKVQSTTQLSSDDLQYPTPATLNFRPPPLSYANLQIPRSPVYETRRSTFDNQRSQASYVSEAWSPLSHSSHSELGSKASSASLRTETLHSVSPRPRPESGKLSGGESQDLSTQPSVSASPTVSESSTTIKKSLGPRIWAGTRFLPQFTHEAYLPGEGTCYFYDDGTHCKSVIDGESVNKYWGVTKTGKPRKRLAIACMTCREKKIKCDPDYPQCEQCKKFRRTCRFKNAPRGNHILPGSPPAEKEDQVIHQKVPNEEENSRENPASTQPILLPQIPQHDNPKAEIRSHKRQKNSHCEFTPKTREPAPLDKLQGIPSPQTPFSDKIVDSMTDLHRQCHTNPYVTQPDIVTEFLSNFFLKVPETINGILPERPFKKWALTTEEKSIDDYTVLYGILALASVFSSKPEQKALGPYFASICTLGCQHRPFSLQLVQSRIFLALYQFSRNRLDEAWDYCGQATRTAIALKLNLELDKCDQYHIKTFAYGLNRVGFAECRRRTFWSIYFMDKFNGFCSGKISILLAQNIFLRLPCENAKFESQTEIYAPFFNYPTVTSPSPEPVIGCLAYLVKIVTIWEDVLAETYRRSQRDLPLPLAAFGNFYDNTVRRMSEWYTNLPECYLLSNKNLKLTARNGDLGTMILMHCIYHNTGMKLNRYIPQAHLSFSQVTQHINAAQKHAESLLTVLDSLHATYCLKQNLIPYHDLVETKFSSPFVGHCIISSIDILTAKISRKSISSRINSFKGSMAILSDLTTFWQSSSEQYNLVSQRINELARLIPSSTDPISNMEGSQSEDIICVMFEPLEKIFSREDDCLYNPIYKP